MHTLSRVNEKERKSVRSGMSLVNCPTNLHTLLLRLQGPHGDGLRLTRVHFPLNFDLRERERILIRHGHVRLRGWSAKRNVTGTV